MKRDDTIWYPNFRSRPELRATRDAVLHLGLKAPKVLEERIAPLSQKCRDIIYEHAIVGRQFAFIARDWHYAESMMVRWWQRALAEYYDYYHEKTEG